MKVNIVEILQQPEHTGENRCAPCTVLNLLIAVLVSFSVARKSRIGGLFTGIGSATLIYLRGYLIPGTPTITKRYLPSTVLRWFEKDSDTMVATGLTDTETATVAPTTASGESPVDNDSLSLPENLESYFLEQNIVEPCDTGDDLCLTERFETAWAEEIDPLTEVDPTAVEAADAFGFDINDQQINLDIHSEARFLRSENGQIGQWPSHAAFIADIAASRLLHSWLSDWDAYDPRQKGQILNTLRLFLEICPTTGGNVKMEEEVVESCCSSNMVITTTCEDTGERLFEQQIDSVTHRERL